MCDEDGIAGPQCIHLELKCDDRQDCLDNKDEIGCLRKFLPLISEVKQADI